MIDSAVKAVLLLFLLIVIYFVVRRVYKRIKLARMSSPQYRKIYSSRKPTEKDSRAEVKKTNVIGMVNCEYCGALMPQLATSCPNCGAPRKS